MRIQEEYLYSPLERWLRKSNVLTKELADLIGCSRSTLWKAKKGVPICPQIAEQILIITGGEVKLETKPVGRQWHG